MARKRSAKPLERPTKKAKHEASRKGKGKEKAADRGFIPIPTQGSDDDEEIDLSEQDIRVLETGAGFLSILDHSGISRSKKETARLHRLTKPIRQQRVIDDDLPSVDSHSEDEQVWSSDIGDPSESDASSSNQSASDSDVEMPYEMVPRNRSHLWVEESQGVRRLPIKLADGRVIDRGRKSAPASSSSESEETQFEDESLEEVPKEDVSTAARFGRPTVVDVIANPSRKLRIQSAKDQIASICQDIISDPEHGLGLLRRLHTFSLPSISTPSHPQPIDNDPVIRRLAILSQLAVFKDIIPGYSIRQLSDKEKAQKVSQQVAQTRDWEQGLVAVYQTYLRSLESELKARSDLSDVALRCMCTLLTEATHFNFRTNLMSCIVARLSKKDWSETSELCLDSLIKVFRADLTGSASLEIVRLLNRMVKERKFNVHPAVIGCLLHLRLKTELGTRASESKADKEMVPKRNESTYLSKKARKLLKERKEIQREFREAEAEVDKEERAATQTETLKLLFVLYFSILKQPSPTPLLPAALEGIAKYAHLVNIDFFKDLMTVLKRLVLFELDGEEPAVALHWRLMCIMTAFDLLTGQGEALNIDLSDFITQLYGMIPELILLMSMDDSPPPHVTSRGQTLTDLLFRVLNTIFSSRTGSAVPPTWRAAAFTKRLLAASLHWPPATTLKVLNFVGGLMARDPKLRSLMSTEERTIDGIYRSDIDDPQLCNPMAACLWEVYALYDYHWDAQIRNEAEKLINMSKC